MRKRALVLVTVVLGIASAAISERLPYPEHEIANVAAFARLYGVARYFFPSDAAAELDWNRFAVHGVARVRHTADQATLRTTLLRLFSPLGPGFEVSGRLPAAPAPTRADGRLVAWRYFGPGRNPGGVPGPYRGKRTARTAARIDGFVTVMRTVPAAALRGRPIRLRGRLRASVTDETGNAALWLRVDLPDQKTGFFDNMSDRPVREPAWRLCEIEGEVATDAVSVAFGVMASGAATADFDALELAVKDRDGAWTPVTFDDAGFEAREGAPGNGWFRAGSSRTAAVTRPDSGRSKDTGSSGSPPGRREPRTRSSFRMLPRRRGLTSTSPSGWGSRRAFRSRSRTERPARTRRVAGRSTRSYSPSPPSPVRPESPAPTSGSPTSSPSGAPSGISIRTGRRPESTGRLASSPRSRPRGPRRRGRSSATCSAGSWPRHATVTGSWRTCSRRPRRRSSPYGSSRSRAGSSSPRAPRRKHRSAPSSRRSTVCLPRRGSRRRRASAPEPTAGARSRAPTSSPAGPTGARVTLRVDDGRGPRTVSLSFDRLEPPPEKRPEPIVELEPGIWYVDLTRTEISKVTPRLEEIARARGVVFDVRGYPGDAGARILPYLLDAGENDRWMHVARITGPLGEAAGWNSFGWNLSPVKPHIGGKVVFLSDARAISYAESVMGYVADRKLGTIVGSDTAGTNGNVVSLATPGRFNVGFTGMRVTGHDGRTTFHLVGVRPDIPLVPTVEGLRGGRDEVLERGLAVVRGTAR